MYINSPTTLRTRAILFTLSSSVIFRSSLTSLSVRTYGSSLRCTIVVVVVEPFSALLQASYVTLGFEVISTSLGLACTCHCLTTHTCGCCMQDFFFFLNQKTEAKHLLKRYPLACGQGPSKYKKTHTHTDNSTSRTHAIHSCMFARAPDLQLHRFVICRQVICIIPWSTSLPSTK